MGKIAVIELMYR